MSNTTKPKMTDTKAEIMAKYKALEAKMNETKVQTTEQVVEAKKKEVATVAAAKTTGSIIDSIEKTATTAIHTLLNLTTQCNELDEAIAIKTQEIKDIHDFEYNANSTATIIAAQNEILAEKTAEAKTICR